MLACVGKAAITQAGLWTKKMRAGFERATKSGVSNVT